MKPKRRVHKPAFRRRTKPGASPGLLVADPAAAAPRMSLFAYSQDALVEREVRDVAEVAALRAKHDVVWLNVDGLGDAAVVESIGKLFGLHRLALEDVLNAHQRPKVDHYDDHSFVVARMLCMHAEELEGDQLGLFLGKGFVVTFQERAGDNFEPVRDRLRRGSGNLRRLGADYLAYALLDAVVDEYFPVLESLGERLSGLENELIDAPRRELLSHVQAIRSDLLALRRATWPLRDVLSTLFRQECAVIAPATRPYLADTYDHTVQIIDLVEQYREIASGLIDIYLSSMSQRLNEVMKVLTIISTIFIPLTFIAGVYGMNFDPKAGPLSMPELSWPYGYVGVLAVMAAIGIALALWFRARGWLGPRS